jgi:hypothetical protein
LVTRVKHAEKSSAKKKKKKEEVQNIETNKEDNTSEGNGYSSPGGGDDANGQGGGDEGENQGEGEATPPKYPLLKQRRRGWFLRRKLRQERRPMLVIPI